MSTFVVYASAVQAQSDADATWTAYRDARLAALGRAAGHSVDSYLSGAEAPAVTNAYCKPYVATAILAAIRVDANVSAAINTSTAIDGSLLPAPLQAIVPSPLSAVAVVEAAADLGV